MFKICILFVFALTFFLPSVNASQCYISNEQTIVDRGFLKKDSLFTVKEKNKKLTIFGKDISWKKDVDPLLGDIGNGFKGNVTIIADTITIDSNVIVKELQFKLITDELKISNGKFLVQDEIKILDSDEKYNPKIDIYTNKIEGKLALSTMGLHRKNFDEAPIRIYLKTSSEDAFLYPEEFGLSYLHPGMCNHCLQVKYVNDSLDDESVKSFVKFQSKLAYWVGRRIYISSLINPVLTDAEAKRELEILERLSDNKLEFLSNTIPPLSYIYNNIEQGKDAVGNNIYGASLKSIRSEKEDFIFQNETLQNDGLISDLLTTFYQIKENNLSANNIKKILEENITSRKKLLKREEKILIEISNFDKSIVNILSDINKNEETLKDFIDFDIKLAEIEARKKEQFANVASGAKLVITIGGGIAGGWGPAVAGAISVGADPIIAKELGSKYDFKKSIENGYEAFQTAKKINKAYKSSKEQWNKYKNNRNELRKKRRDSSDVEGSWIDAVKLTEKQLTDKDKKKLKKEFSFYKDINLEKFSFEPVVNNSKETNDLLSKKTELEKQRIKLMKVQADLVATHISITSDLDAIEAYSIQSSFLSSVEAGYEQRSFLLTNVLDKTLIDFFKSYNNIKSSLRSHNINYPENELDSIAWTIFFRDYLKLVTFGDSLDVSKSKLEEFIQSLKTASTAITYKVNKAIIDSQILNFKWPINVEINIADIPEKNKNIGEFKDVGINIVKIPDIFLTDTLVESSKVAFIESIKINGDSASDWTLYSATHAYRFRKKLCELVPGKINEWFEIGSNLGSPGSEPLRYKQMYLLPKRVSEKTLSLPSSISIQGYVR